ncbi:hypothetical protein TRIATDRAFT_256492 [Trichoderma atroviride IMI 206040]|uniref:Uncharacterized protein n=1 Tax=Hypocrea atroviridis (strain ATCC 20476 / IMI 206040) TaxID=452589 RepID=G9NRC7_HYPAI|nr:uncharacterized protein TRIATDRAFT_256492 [Trichoderma atroviride IMI 206040]EHK46563.1 hypothetical protein TRIATDRAFT_256492 [Trichoderma atroviride IMI 206040]
MQTRQQALQVQGLGHVLGEGRVKQAQAGKKPRVKEKIPPQVRNPSSQERIRRSGVSSHKKVL